MCESFNVQHPVGWACPGSSQQEQGGALLCSALPEKKLSLCVWAFLLHPCLQWDVVSKSRVMHCGRAATCCVRVWVGGLHRATLYFVRRLLSGEVKNLAGSATCFACFLRGGGSQPTLNKTIDARVSVCAEMCLSVETDQPLGAPPHV
eukprot:TRINITY_DN13550_c0_g1_i1.p1 TRINITY_DN13550_c0_g1~~TRINITY_DN13550_c0_g1_i1.p1  ORF type:complete len:148 (+),score=0.18 TRINITY_DN13550_c0_g1_i1:317-760(+)